MTNQLFIVGAGGLGKEVCSMLSLTDLLFKGFIDDNVSNDQVICSIDDILIKQKSESLNLAIAVGSSESRQNIVKRLPENVKFPSIIHPSVIFQNKNSIEYGRGNIICAGSIFTCDITLGDFCLVNLNCTIGHDVKIGDFCSLMPSVNLSGNVTLEEGVFVGAGASILPGITIGKNTVIGAGAVVTENIPPDCTAVGIPAKPIKFNNKS